MIRHVVDRARRLTDRRRRPDPREALDAMQWWTEDRIRDWQWSALTALLAHAATSVPFYRERFASLGLTVGDVAGWEDFAGVPALTKADLQRGGDRLRAPGMDGRENHTGGSTGEPVSFYQDAEYRAWSAATREFAFSLCGRRPGDRQVFLWGSDRDARAHVTWAGRTWDRLHNVRWVNAFDLSAAALRKVAEELARWRPDCIWGYASSLDLLADELARSRLTLRPRAVQSTAGTLYPSLRARLVEAFGPVVYDRYGCREVSVIAHECEAHQGLHEMSAHNYVELVGEKPPYRVVVTNLHNFAFPFIRYDVGDLALRARSACRCGRGLPVLDRVVGRTVEVVSSPSGKLIDGEFFTHLFYGLRGVRQFQVCQDSLDHLTITIVGTSELRRSSLDRLRALIATHGDPAFRVDVRLADGIPPGASGKRAFVISRVPRATDGGPRPAA